VEGIGRARERGLEPFEAATQALRALGPALLGTTATTVIVLLPLMWLEGVVGRFFTALAVTLSAAVVLSLVVAVSIVPIAAIAWLKSGPRAGQGSQLGVLYARLARPMFAHPFRVAAIAAAMLALGIVGALRVSSGFLPTMDEGAFVLDYYLPAGTSLGDTDSVASRIEALLGQLPEIESWSRRTGAELGPSAATLVNRGDIMVRLRPQAQRQRSADEIVTELRAQLLADVPEARVEFVQVLQDVLNDLSGAPRPIELKLFGDDDATLRQAALVIAEAMHDLPGLVDVYQGFEDETPELRLRVDLAATARAGLTSDGLAKELDAALHGVVAGILRRPDRTIGIRVRFPDALRFDPEQLTRVPIVTPAGAVIPLASLALAQRDGTATVLTRESLRPVVVLTADHEGRDLGAVVREVKQKLAGLTLPPGVLLELGGQYEGQQDTLRQLSLVMIFGVLAVSIVLLMQFRRASLVLVVLASVPLALGGAIDALWLTRTALNASSLMGCVLLVGLVVKNGILLLEHFETGLAGGSDVMQAMLEAGGVRARPIVMTTLATVAGLAPLALGLGAGAELQRPLAIAVIGGLVVSTAVTLFLTPALVLLFSRRSQSS
jgi:multidrug efflux pump subunit AcrB